MGGRIALSVVLKLESLFPKDTLAVTVECFVCALNVTEVCRA